MDSPGSNALVLTSENYKHFVQRQVSFTGYLHCQGHRKRIDVLENVLVAIQIVVYVCIFSSGIDNNVREFAKYYSNIADHLLWVRCGNPKLVP